MKKNKKLFQLEIVNESEIEQEREALFELGEAENGPKGKRISVPLR